MTAERAVFDIVIQGGLLAAFLIASKALRDFWRDTRHAATAPPLAGDARDRTGFSGEDHDKIKAEGRAMVARAFIVMFEKHGSSRFGLAAMVEGMFSGIAHQVWASRQVNARPEPIIRFVRDMAEAEARKVTRA